MSTASENKHPACNGTLVELLREAIAYNADRFDGNESINGANLVEWFAIWRRLAAEALKDSEKPQIPRRKNPRFCGNSNRSTSRPTRTPKAKRAKQEGVHA